MIHAFNCTNARSDFHICQVGYWGSMERKTGLRAPEFCRPAIPQALGDIL